MRSRKRLYHEDHEQVQIEDYVHMNERIRSIKTVKNAKIVNIEQYIIIR